MEQTRLTLDEFREWVKKNDPKHLHTFDWDQCPEDWDNGCYCRECRAIMAQDG